MVSLRLGLDPLIEALGDEMRTRAHTTAFKSAFLHELGHIIHTPYHHRGQAREEALAPAHPRRRELDSSLVALAERPAAADLLDRMIDYLEDARVERLLLEEFRGAPQFLGENAHLARKRLASVGADEVEQTLAYLFLGIRGGPADLPASRVPLGGVQRGRPARPVARSSGGGRRGGVGHLRSVPAHRGPDARGLGRA